MGKKADLKQGNEVMYTLSTASTEDVDKWPEALKKRGGVFSVAHLLFDYQDIDPF